MTIDELVEQVGKILGNAHVEFGWDGDYMPCYPQLADEDALVVEILRSIPDLYLKQECPKCGGSGEMKAVKVPSAKERLGYILVGRDRTCPKCKGEGSVMINIAEALKDG